MPTSGIHGRQLEVVVFGCTDLKNREIFTKQDPYVLVEYCESRQRTKTCKDGGRNPHFNDKLAFTLIEGQEQIQVEVWNSNKLTPDDHIGSVKVPLSKVLREGYDDSIWPLHCKNGRPAGVIQLILHYWNADRHATNETTPVASRPPPSAPPQSRSCARAPQPPGPCPPVAVCSYQTTASAYQSPPAPASGYPPVSYPPPPPVGYHPPPAYPYPPYPYSAPPPYPGAQPPY